MQTRRRTKLVATLLIWGTAVAFGFLLWFSESGSNSGQGEKSVLILAAVLFCSLCLWPFIHASRSGKLDLFEPIYAFALIYMLYFGLRAVQIAFAPETLWFPSLTGSDTPFFMQAVVYASFGVMALFLGYYFRFPQSLPTFASQSEPQVSHRAEGRILLLLSVAWAARVYLILTGQFNAGFVQAFLYEQVSLVNSVLQMLSSLPPLFLAIVLFGVLQKRLNRNMLVCVLVAGLLELVYATLSGVKGAFVALILILLMASLYSRLRVRFVPILVGVLAVVFIVFPLMSAYRSTYRSVYGGPLELSPANIDHHSEVMVDYLVNNFSATTAIGEVISRAYGVDSLAAAVKFVPTTGFFYGQSYINALVQLVPRAVFPSRPSLFSVGFEYRFVGFPEELRTVVQVPLLTEAYLNGGLVGILIVMFLNGVLLRYLYLFLGRSQCYTYVALYVFLLTQLILIEHSFVTIYVNSLVKGGIVNFLMAFWIARGNVVTNPRRNSF